MPEVYGVQFGTIHSWRDWGVYLSDNSFDPAQPRKAFIDIPFRNGLLDATKAVSNRIFFETRKNTYTFLVQDNKLSWPELYSKIMGQVHGQALHIVTDMDPDYYWDAYNCVLQSPSRDEDIGEFSIECECYPFRLKHEITSITGTVDGENVVIICPNSRMEVSPVITTSAPCQLVYTNEFGKTKEVTLAYGENNFEDLILVEGSNSLTFYKLSANSRVSVSYREGVL